MKKPSLALFDFDGTVTTSDTFVEFIRFSKGWPAFLRGFALLSPQLIAMKLGILPNWKTKELVLRYFFAGEPVQSFEEACERFTRQRLPAILREKAITEIKDHQQAGNRVVIVTASAEDWIRRWAEEAQVELLATRLETANGCLTGRISGKNCHGIEKVTRVSQHLRVDAYENVYVYGDSAGDLPMLKLGNRTFYKPFR